MKSTNRQLANATGAYQAYLETRRQHCDRFEDEELAMLDEDLNKARRVMEIEWLIALGAVR